MVLASPQEDLRARALRQIMALNNMSVTLLERSCPNEARATVRDALDLVRKWADFSADGVDHVDPERCCSWFTDIEQYTGERMRRAGERLSRSSKTVATSAVGDSTSWDVNPIIFDHRAPDPNLQWFLSTDEVALDRKIYPIKVDVFAESEDVAALPEDIVSAIILYNYSLALAADVDTQYCRNGTGGHRTATKLLLMSMELTCQRLDAAGDISEQLGLHTLAILTVRMMIALHQDAAETRDMYRRTHRGLLDRARALASLEATLFGPKLETAAAA